MMFNIRRPGRLALPQEVKFHVGIRRNRHRRANPFGRTSGLENMSHQRSLYRIAIAASL